jgi:hypothetical protein
MDLEIDSANRTASFIALFSQFFPSVCLFSLVPQSFNWEFFSELKDSVLLMAILPTSWKQEFLSPASLVAGEIWFFSQ